MYMYLIIWSRFFLFFFSIKNLPWPLIERDTQRNLFELSSKHFLIRINGHRTSKNFSLLAKKILLGEKIYMYFSI